MAITYKADKTAKRFDKDKVRKMFKKTAKLDEAKLRNLIEGLQDELVEAREIIHDQQVVLDRVYSFFEIMTEEVQSLETQALGPSIRSCLPHRPSV